MAVFMRWKIAQFVFCDQQQTLTSELESQQLEPMMVELLSYFCQNTNQIISKDQLIEQVWLGRIVSDNAVSKLITKLRKALADNVRKPKFIATFPKKGYKFIALVEPLTDNAQLLEPSATEQKPDINLSTNSLTRVKYLPRKTSLTEVFALSKNKPVLWRTSFLTLFVILFIVVFAWFGFKNTEKQPILTHAKALTRDAGNEFSPSISPDGTRVAYMLWQDERMQLMIKNIADERTIDVDHGIEAGVGPASWSEDGELLIYLVATPERCQYYLRTIDNLTLGEPRLIHNCPTGSYGKVLFTHDNERVVFAQTTGINTPYSLFEMNVSTGGKRRLSQPALYLGGNSQFDLHPTDNKLLISSPDEQQWEGFYSLDLDSDTLRLLFKQDAYICCGIWSHDGERVILMGEYPAYQLLSYDLSGNDMQIIYSGTQKLDRPSRHTNGKDYLFSSDQNDMNISLTNLISKKNAVIADSTVDDRLATFAPHNEQIAYISLTTGSEEVWLTTVEHNQRTKLTNFNDSRHYVDLKWSPNGKLLMALTLNEIHIIDVQTGTFNRLKISQTEIRAVSFKDKDFVSYSIKIGRKWRAHQYQLSTNVASAIDEKWQYIQYTHNSENTLWIDQKNNLYWGKEQNPIKDEILLKQDLLYNRVFNLKKINQQWFWFDHDAGRYLIMYSPTSGKLTHIVQTDVLHFDIKENQVVYGQLQRINSDIYQTQSLNY